MARARRTGSRTSKLRTWRTAARWSVKEAQDAVGACNVSGLTVEAFCRKHGLKVERMQKWVRRVGAADVGGRQTDGAGVEAVNKQPEAVHWVQARVKDTQTDIAPAGQGVTAVKIHLAGGQIIDVVRPGWLEPQWLARLARDLSMAQD